MIMPSRHFLRRANIKVFAFLQLRNELENGNLVRCLDNCKVWADRIFIYDDASTDGSKDVYESYAKKSDIIYGTERAFDKELFHKQRLFELLLDAQADWIGWIDGDAILDKRLTTNLKQHLSDATRRRVDGIKLHNMNLWRHPAFYRIDNSFDGLWHMVFWRNNGSLKYLPEKGLHQQQYPIGMRHIINLPSPSFRLLHYGFSSERLIAKKYLTYKSYGQTGLGLERLVDERSSFVLCKVPSELYPPGLLPADYSTVTVPKPITYDEYRQYNSWEEYVATGKDKGPS